MLLCMPNIQTFGTDIVFKSAGAWMLDFDNL